MAIKGISSTREVASNSFPDLEYIDNDDNSEISSINSKIGIDTSLRIPFSDGEDIETNEVDIEEIIPEISKIDLFGNYKPLVETNVDLTPYSQYIRSKSQASSYVKETNGKITTDNKTYIILPDDTYTGEEGTISESDYNLLITVIAGEGGNDVDDMLGVASTIFNRLESGGKGDTVREVLEIGYFPFGESFRRYIPGGKFYNTESGQEKLVNAQKVVNDALCGVRNTVGNVYYYYGDGEHNYFSDVV